MAPIVLQSSSGSLTGISLVRPILYGLLVACASEPPAAGPPTEHASVSRPEAGREAASPAPPALRMGGANLLFLGEGLGGAFNVAATDTAGLRIRRALDLAEPMEEEFLARVARQLGMLPAALPASGWLDLAPARRMAGRMFLEAGARRCAYLAALASLGDPWLGRWRDGNDHAAEWIWWTDTVSGLSGRLQADGSVVVDHPAAGP